MLLHQAWMLGFVCVLAVSASMVGYGVFAVKKLGPGFFHFFLGFALFLVTLYSVGLMGFYSKTGVLVVLVVGWLALAQEWQLLVLYARRFRKNSKVHLNWLWLVFPVLYAIARFLGAGLPQQHSDPLYYHLLGPKLWAKWGTIKVVEAHPSLVQAALWEAVYGIPQIFLFFLKPLSKNITTQIFSQWMHFFWGQVASVFVVYQLLKKAVAVLGAKLGGNLCKPQLVFFAWLITSLPAIQWTSVLAKNDYMVMLFSFLAFAAVLEKKFTLGGFFAGILFSVKMTGFWTVGALVLLIPFSAANWGAYVAGGLAGALPNLVRSLRYTKNPVFPALDHLLGPGWISDGWAGANGTFIGAPALKGMGFWFWDQFLNMGLSKVLFFLGVAGYAALCLKKKKLFFTRELGCILLQAAVALLMLKPLANGRYTSPVLALLLVFTLAALLVVLTKHAGKFGRAQWVLLALGLLINVPVDSFVKIPRDYLFKSADLYLKKFHPLYPMQEQINAVVPAGAPVFMATEKVNYYLDHDFECTTEMRRWERVFKQATSAKELIGNAQQMGYRYFQYYPNHSRLFAGWVLPAGFEQYDHKALIKNHDFVVLDLKK